MLAPRSWRWARPAAALELLPLASLARLAGDRPAAREPPGALLKLEGIHHITAITADAPRNVDFYARVLGLRLVKKSVNQDDPTVYHLFYGDEEGTPGNDITFFEYPRAARGRAGLGMVHRILWRVASGEAVDFWARRVAGEGVATREDDGALVFSDPEGLEHELRVVDVPDEPLTAHARDVPDEHALQGFDAVRAYTLDPERSRRLLEEGLAFERSGDGEWEARGEERGGRMIYDVTDREGVPGAGTVHHVAWASRMDEHEEWRRRAIEAGARPTPVIDRFYFRSVYFREPSGVLFELATIGPGFAVDEPLESLGERLSLPPSYEELRDRLERVLTPLPDTRPWRRERAPAEPR
jgi:glyoxalase family protein